jgi:hypothetical protein
MFMVLVMQHDLDWIDGEGHHNGSKSVTILAFTAQNVEHWLDELEELT